MSIPTPTKATLQKYGLTEDEWKALSHKRCPICAREPKRLVVDHEHVPGWKQMPPEQRKKYVRGLTCWTCNYFLLQHGMTETVAENLIRYFVEYERRRLNGTTEAIATERDS